MRIQLLQGVMLPDVYLPEVRRRGFVGLALAWRNVVGRHRLLADGAVVAMATPSQQAARMREVASPQSLDGWYVISLRPQGQHAGLRRAAAAHGAKVLALSPLRIEPSADPATVAALRAALAAQVVVFTSPNAVRAAAALQPLRARRGQAWLGVGAGTAAALRRAGIADAAAPARMDSEGLLALPVLQHARGRTVGLVTAPGGRDRLAPALRARGATLRRVDVYARRAIAPSPRALARLRTLDAPLLLALSSAEALESLFAAVPDEIRALVRRARVLAASERLARLARSQGFDDIVVATSARPGDLMLAALSGHA
jgi:uroporphyrinogen-III synthase